MIFFIIWIVQYVTFNIVYIVETPNANLNGRDVAGQQQVLWQYNVYMINLNRNNIEA